MPYVPLANEPAWLRNIRQAPPNAPVAGTPAAQRTAIVGWVSLQATDHPGLTVLCELGDNAPRIVGGYGGWDEVERQGREAITVWRGFRPLAIELELFLDDLDAGRSVEPTIDILEALAGRGRRRLGGQPPVVAVDTAGVMPHDIVTFPDLRWVITDLEWDDDGTIVNDHGNRVRAPVTVSLLQHVADTRLADRAHAAKGKVSKNGKGSKRTHKVKSGETLMTIARRELHDAGRWREIADLNGIRDPRNVKPGRTLRLP